MENKNPTVETIKELGRWAILIAIAWVITETLKQIVNVPEFATIKIWVFAYDIPVRLLLQLALSGLGRLVDRLVHVSESIKANGILPF